MHVDVCRRDFAVVVVVGKSGRQLLVVFNLQSGKEAAV